MTPHLIRRLTAFCGFIVVMIMLVGSSAVTAWRDIGGLRGLFTKAQFESFRVAGELQSSVLSLDSGLLAYEITGEQADWEHFQTESHPLDEWIDLKRSALKTEDEKRALGVLAAGVAHEIRNPLTALKTRVFTLRKKLDPDAPALEDATIIEDEIEHLDCIVSDFLPFARPGDPDLAEFTSNELLCEVRALLSPQLAKNEVELAVESTADETTLRADRQQLKQVLINLVRNAFENIGQKGRITLRSRQCHLPLHGRQQEVAVLEVEDTGSGIPTKVRGRLFDPFFTTKPAGTGLGLSIAMRILEQHGGTLQFQTALGRGTTFGVILPLPSPEPRVAPDQESTANITPALRIVKGSQIT